MGLSAYYFYHLRTRRRCAPMGKVAGAQNFDGRNWHEQHIAKRTREALDEQDQAFAVRHAESTLNELACYLRRCAEHWGKSPAPCEIVGGDYIAERFGGWTNALQAAHLDAVYKKPNNRANGRYQREMKRQIELYRAERDAKRTERAKKELERQRNVIKAAQTQKKGSPDYAVSD